MSAPHSPHLAARLIGRLAGRFAGLVHELGKFGVVGGVAYVINSTVVGLWLVAYPHPDPDHPHPDQLTHRLIGLTVATIISASVAFVGNRFWTWRHRMRSGLHREYLLFSLFNAVGLAIQYGCLLLSERVLSPIWSGFQSPIAVFLSTQVVGVAFGTVFRFWAYRRYVFRTPEPAV